MRQIYYAALTYMVLGLAGGLGYREITKAAGFTGDTQLAVVHTHLLVLGMLVVLLLVKVFTLSSSRVFPWFFWVYNVGVVTAAFLAINGTRTVLGETSGAALAGMAGFGHMLLTAGLVLFFVCLRSRLNTHERRRATGSAPGTRRRSPGTGEPLCRECSVRSSRAGVICGAASITARAMPAPHPPERP